MKARDVIRSHYGDKKAQRSQVPLMNHINEGLDILNYLCASEIAKDAFCIHPIIQCNESNFEFLQSYKEYPLAVEYSDKANAYLCCTETDYVESNEDIRKLVGPMSKDCRDMLIADKIQNRKDFLLHHYGTHKRSKQLNKYFNQWLTYLFSEEWK